MSFKRKLCLMGVLCLLSVTLTAQNMYLELNLNAVRAGRAGSFFALQKQPLEVFRVIEKAADDSRISGIVLNIGSVLAEREHLWELRGALEKFKTASDAFPDGKKIVAFISNADMDVYCLASAADKIVMDELGTLSMFGYAAGRGFARQALEKLGIGARELRYFEYKSASEMFTRDSMSDADRRQYSDYLDDIFTVTRNTLMEARGWTAQEFNSIINDEFMYSARSALKSGLVDYTGRKDAVVEAIKEIEGKDTVQFAVYGGSSSSLTGAEMTYSPPGAGGLFSKPPVVAVVYADGQTDMETGMEASRLSRIIRDLADNRRVSAIVVRINSPGGSAEAADHFAEAVRYAKEKKPVVASMGSVAASGGYWAAIHANHIVATPYTITGSIGVIGSWFYDNGLNEKLGVNIDTIQRGDHADLLTGFLFPHRDLTEQEERRYRAYILDLYDIFVEKVAAARGLEIEEVEAAAQGRIFSGNRALEAGLIDSIGGLSDALRIARELAGIADDKKVLYREFPEPTFWERVLHNFPVTAGLFARKKTNALTDLIDSLLPRAEMPYRLENNGKVMPILPLDFYGL